MNHTCFRVSVKMLFLLACLAGIRAPGAGAVFVGTNAPGAASNFAFTNPVAVTNLSLTISNNTGGAFSHLLLKQGGTPTDSDYDFIAQLDGAPSSVTNAINLQLPEVAAGMYGFRVRTPGNSAEHAFVVTLLTNITDLRTATHPATKPQSSVSTGSLTTGQFHYFRIEIPTASPGWRLVLNSSGPGNGEIYVRKNALPDTGSFDKRVVGLTNATIVYTDAELTAGGAYFIAVRANGGATGYTLYSESGYLTTLTWDPGTTPGGTQVYSNSNPAGGFFYFKMQTQNAGIGAWRTALKVFSGEADVFLKQGAPASDTDYSFQSSRTGSDGMVLHASQFSAGQDWFITVRATPGATWTLTSGEVFAYDLGPLAADASSSTNVHILPEGMAFFKTTIVPGTLAWRLGLNGATNALYVKKSFVPLPNAYEQAQARAMLLVEPYLAAATFNGTFFVCVPGDPGTALNLDSRQQPVTDIPFGTNLNAIVTTTNFPYLTYRVSVPVQQIAWQLNLAGISGDANLAVRRDKAPNEFQNDAFSDLPGSVGDSVTLVPPALSDGTFYVTVYATGAFNCAFSNGNPVITDVNYIFGITNDAPTRAGWRFYRVPNIAQQLGTLGWDLVLSNQPPGTELALRQNAVPGRWNFRNADGDYGYGSQGYVDVSGLNGFIQRPGHQADIWYIGVYSPTTALGNFVLTGSELTGQTIAFDAGAGTSMAVTNQPPGKWKYFRIDVPTNTFGWDLRLINATNGNPLFCVRRDQLPDAITTSFSPQSSPTWPSGERWAGQADWTGYLNAPDGSPAHSPAIACGMGNPLQAGTYYVGVIDPTGSSSFTLQSRGIGTGFAIPIRDLNYSGAGSSTNLAGLAAREAAYFRVVVPSNSPSWKAKLTSTAGESLLQVAKDFLPNIRNGNQVVAGYGGKRMQQPGNEHFALLPNDGFSTIAAGTYYLAVVGEGVGPDSTQGRVGAGISDYTLASLGAVPVTDLGTLTNLDILRTNALEAGELAAYRFSVASNVQAMEVRLENRTGNPRFYFRQINALVQPNGFGFCDTPTFEGGYANAYAGDTLVPLANPAASVYSMTVLASVNGSCLVTNATYIARLHPVTAAPLAFDGGTASVTNHEPGSWRFFAVTVPSNAVGWDARLINVTNNAPGVKPQLFICRDLFPPGTGSIGLNAPSWGSGYQVVGDVDWTGYNYNADGTEAHAMMRAMGMGNPLEPGNYFIGILDNVGSSYTVQSRGIGTNMSIIVRDLNFSGPGSSTNGSGLPPREADYYRVVIASNTPSWRLRLTNSVGEASLLIQKGALPNPIAPPGGSTQNLTGGRKQQRIGDEQFALLADDGLTNIAPGTYYLAVVSEGVGPIPNQSRSGAGPVSYNLASLGTVPVIDLGSVTVADLVHTNSLPGGGMAAYQFTVPPGTLSIELSLENTTGAPEISGRRIDRVVAPFWSIFGFDYSGSESGQGRVFGGSLVTLSSPSNGVYSVSVNATTTGGPVPADYTLRVHALTVTELAFDGGTAPVTNQNAGSWRYFHVTVPPDTLGWDLRLVNASSNTPVLVVQRDTLPDVPSGNTFGRNNVTNWPSGARWTVDGDWTGYNSGPDGAATRIATLACGMGNPLEPGSYYIGVFCSGGPASYFVQSRGIGMNQSILVRDLNFSGAGSSTNITGLIARDAAYFRVVVPSNSPSWRVRVAPTTGEAMLLLNRAALPCVISGGPLYAAPNGGKSLKQPGNEHYCVLPADGGTNIPPGTYYLGVVSEGVNPTSSRYGSNSTSFAVASLGTLPVMGLGTVGAGDLTASGSLEGGDIASYRFNVPANAVAVEVRLENVTGLPGFTLRQTDRTVAALWAVLFSCDYSGSELGDTATLSSGTLVTPHNPSAGTYSVTVSAHGTAGNCAAGSPDADYTLRVRQLFATNLNFSSELNTNGNTNVVSGVLLDDQRAFYRVVVPANLGAAPVLGWRLDLAASSGAPQFRVRPDSPPQDGGAPQTPFLNGSALLVPPFVTNGTWYVEVKGVGASTFTLTSRGFTTNSLQRPPWVMPAIAQTNVAPGVALPEIGDSGTDTNGVALPGDRGIDLADNTFHYYAVTVPVNNAGLLRTELDAISGNPNLYLRVTNAPTLSHDPSGNGGFVFDRVLSGPTTEYGNWVPISGRYESALAPGTWFIAVHAAGGSNCRYRLRVACGNPVPNALVQNLSLDGGLVTNQNLAGGDWRYYRLAVPSNAPANVAVNFSRSLGSARLFVRDTTPPGDQGSSLDYDNMFYANSAATWATDNKNQGPYPRYDSPGVVNLSTPPLRPGSTYYLGVWSGNDTTFSLSTSTNNGMIITTNIIPFYGGSLTNTLPANGSLLARVDVPPDATRWKSIASHADTLTILLEQGTIPIAASQHYSSGQSPNSSINQYLLSNNGWPWLPAKSYYLLFTNTTASPSPFTFIMDGRNAVTDDDDNDGLPDAWERAWFGGLGYNGASDPDGDGVPNSQEHFLGTNPTNAATRPVIIAFTHGASNRYDVLFTGETGQTYRVQYSANLAAWSNLASVPVTNSPATISDSPPPGVSNRFYRVVLP